MRILILANNDAGLFKFRRELLEQLIQIHKVYVSIPDGEFVTDIQAIGCKVVIDRVLDRRGTDPVRDLKLLEYYKHMIKKIRPGIVLTYTIKPNVYGGIACDSLRIPYIANVTGLGTSIKDGGILQKIALILYKRGLRNAQKVFFQNEENKAFFIRKGIVKKRYDVLPGSGVNIEQHCYEKYPEDTKNLIFSVFGRIMKDKGIDEILSAAKVIKSEFPYIKVRLVGDFEEGYENKVKAAARKGIVEYIEYQKDIHPFIKESHAIIHASYHEGMSNVLLESASTGRPVIASNIPGCREIYEEGITGIGFNPHDTEDLIRALRKFINLPYDVKASMGRAGREKVKKNFDRKIVIQRYMDEIQLIAERC